MACNSFDFDVIVIGGGPGGYEAAIRCAQYNLKTALVEAAQLGGTCLNRGCIPTKTLLHSAEMYAETMHFKEMGLESGSIQINYATMVSRKDKVVSQLRSGIAFLEKSHGVTLFSGKGLLADAHTVCIDNQKITSKYIILATGSIPAKPPIPGINEPNILTSDEVLSLAICPEKIVIVGGGVIGLEFATLFASLGKKVTIVEMLPSLLSALDSDMAAFFMNTLKSKEIDIYTSAAVSSLKGGSTIICDYVQNGKRAEVSGDICIICTGRVPLTRDIGLEDIGVLMDRRGFIEVNDCMQTSIPNIYAIGDITGKIQLAHVATAQGMTAAANISGRTSVMKYDIIPACIYTSPEIAYVGMNNAQAEAAGFRIQTGIFNISGNGKAMSMGQNVGMIKLISDAYAGQILGAQFVAPHATDLIGELCVAMKHHMRVDELSTVIHPHPTISECILEAAHASEGLCCNTPAIRKQQ